MLVMTMHYKQYVERKAFFAFIVFTYVYMGIIQPWICFELWQYWYLRPIAVYIATVYVFPIVALLASSGTVLIDVFCGGDVRAKSSSYIVQVQLWLFSVYGTLMFGHETHGMEHIADPSRGALIVYYHGMSVVDQVLFTSEVYRRVDRVLGGIVDHVLLLVPIVRTHLKVWGFTASREHLVEALKNGRVMSVSPGGAYEAMFSENYSVEWRGRSGFAAVAKEAGVPVIPSFTTNIRQHQDMIFLAKPFRDFLERCYLTLKIPFGLFMSALPVEMKTYLGEPLHCGQDESPDHFAIRIQRALEDLIARHQRMPPSTAAALLERVGISW